MIERVEQPAVRKRRNRALGPEAWFNVETTHSIRLLVIMCATGVLDLAIVIEGFETTSDTCTSFRQPTNRDGPARLGGSDQGAMGLRASLSAIERGTRRRPLRGAIYDGSDRGECRSTRVGRPRSVVAVPRS